MLVAVIVPFRESLALSTVLLIFLTWVLMIAAIGGRVVAGAAAVVGSLLLNWFFVPPYNTLTIDRPENFVSLVAFVVVAITVGSLVDVAARRAYEAQRARVEATALARSAARLAADPDALPGLLEQIRTIFALRPRSSGLRRWAPSRIRHVRRTAGLGADRHTAGWRFIGARWWLQARAVRSATLG